VVGQGWPRRSAATRRSRSAGASSVSCVAAVVECRVEHVRRLGVQVHRRGRGDPRSAVAWTAPTGFRVRWPGRVPGPAGLLRSGRRQHRGSGAHRLQAGPVVKVRSVPRPATGPTRPRAPS
jgi:hypothetical protein